jgi:hypothetical protein
MRYGSALPNYGDLANPEDLLRLARRAEECGVDSVWVSDHVIIPNQSASIYPYDPSPRPAPAHAAAGVEDVVLNRRDARTIDEMAGQLERVASEVMRG